MKRLIVIASMLVLITGVANSVEQLPPTPIPWVTPPTEYEKYYPGSATVVRTDKFEQWSDVDTPIKISVDVTAKIRQWLYIYWQPVQIRWDIFKPGRFLTSYWESKIISNGNVQLTLENLQKPQPYQPYSPEKYPRPQYSPVNMFFISGPHLDEKHKVDVVDVIEGSQKIQEVIDDLHKRGLLLVPPVQPGESAVVLLPGCLPCILRFGNILEVDFCTPPGKYEARALITITKGLD